MSQSLFHLTHSDYVRSMALLHPTSATLFSPSSSLLSNLSLNFLSSFNLTKSSHNFSLYSLSLKGSIFSVTGQKSTKVRRKCNTASHVYVVSQSGIPGAKTALFGCAVCCHVLHSCRQSVQNYFFLCQTITNPVKPIANTGSHIFT